MAKFGTDWSIFADASINKVKYGKFSNSRADNLDSSDPISSIIKLIRDLMVIYILTKFGADWLIFVDASVNKKIVDGRTLDRHRRTVSDHNSSLSTPCSGELKKKKKTYKLIMRYQHIISSTNTITVLYNQYNTVFNQRFCTFPHSP